MKSQKQLEQELDEKDKVLSFLRQKYEEDTGKKLELPLSWAAFLCMIVLFMSQTPLLAGTKEQLPASAAPPLIPEATGAKYTLETDNRFDTETFISKVHDLKLPQAPYQKKTKNTGLSSTTAKAQKNMLRQLKESVKRQPELRFYLLEEVVLSGYEKKGFTKQGFQELLKGVANLVSLRKVVMSHNGITDECAEEVCELIKNNKIRYLDLSVNKLGKQSAQAMTQVLTETSHLVWFE